jgi:phage/plasmid-like protein (TIGR03299 family)|tara:strand:+ start:3070 stop:4041 length:972 start_codon:yes stop_codon:yes gene_type:complete
MSHEVEIINGQAQMAYAGDVPWHGLGTEVSRDMSPNQIMVKAGLDWSVEKVPTYAIMGDEQIPTGQEALIRSSDNKVLTQVGKNWHPVQNEEAFEFFSEYCLAGDMEMHTAGSLKGGKMTWGLAKVKESFDVLKNDQVDSYLLFSNPHEYGKSIDIRFTPIRVVCNNTLSMALASVKNTGVKMSHRKVFDADMVKEHMGIAHEKFAQYKDVAQFLAKKQFSMDALIQYYNDVFPRTYQGKEEVQVKTIDDLTSNGQKAFEFLESQPGAEFGKGSWWQALNSVTYLTDHHMGREADSRLTSAWFGANQTRKIKAVEKAVALATA